MDAGSKAHIVRQELRQDIFCLRIVAVKEGLSGRRLCGEVLQDILRDILILQGILKRHLIRAVFLADNLCQHGLHLRQLILELVDFLLVVHIASRLRL